MISLLMSTATSRLQPMRETTWMLPQVLRVIILASPMHFRRDPHQDSGDRFSLVTFENQLKIDVGKDCCARGCMSTIGKDKLRSIRHNLLFLTKW